MGGITIQHVSYIWKMENWNYVEVRITEFGEYTGL